jgi:hypothetical protein
MLKFAFTARFLDRDFVTGRTGVRGRLNGTPEGLIGRVAGGSGGAGGSKSSPLVR